jgi:GNAT superfamily N-acetyltransferase
MGAISFQKIKPSDEKLIALIAGWYQQEWNIPIETTKQKFSAHQEEGIPFHFLLSIHNTPVATGGVHAHVSLLDHAPQFKVYEPWLALVYTTMENRKKGYGTLLCEKIQDVAKKMGLKEIFLHTYTAESLYTQMGWTVLERLHLKGKDIVVMKKKL